MSKKDVDKYFNEVCNQYLEMCTTLVELEQEFNNGIISSDRLEQIKQLIIPLKDNYLRLSYIMYLYNLPNKKEKRKKYIKQNNKKLNSIPHEHTQQGVLEENEHVIQSLK